MRRTAFAIFIVVLASGFGLMGCGPSIGRNHGPATPVPGEPITRLQMGMVPEDVGRLLPKTPCRVNTEFHGNPAEAWGYAVSIREEGYRVLGTDCVRADFWVYFEDGHLVGWSPPP